MGCSSSSDKLTDAETTALQNVKWKQVASLFNLLNKEPVDLFKIVFSDEDNPKDSKNGRDFIHTLLTLDHKAFGTSSPPSSVVAILKAFKQTIESNKQKNTPEKKLFREHPQFDKFPYSYLQFVIFNNPEDLESFIFLLDNKETFPSPPPASQSLVHDLCSNPRAIELLRHLISSGEFPERFKNTSSTNNLDEQMRGSTNSVVIGKHRSFTPLQAACAAGNKFAVQELCVAGLGGSNYAECAETLLTTAIAGEQTHNLGSMVLFKNEEYGEILFAQPKEDAVDDVSDILLCLLAQSNAHSSIRELCVKLSSIESPKARDNIVSVFTSQPFNIASPLEILDFMHLAFAYYAGVKENTTDDTRADTFLKTCFDNNLAACSAEERTLTSGVLFGALLKKGEVDLESALKLIEKYRLREWLITSEQELDLSGWGKIVNDEFLPRITSALPSLPTLRLAKCSMITDTGLQHLAKTSSLKSLTLCECDKITDTGLECLSKLSSLQSLDLQGCKMITDNGLQHLAKLPLLQRLDLTECEEITDTGLQNLGDISSLQTLNLQSCDKITDNGLKHIAKMASLQSLNLSRCYDITDDGVQHLVKLSSLHSLDLSYSIEITRSGFQHVAKISSLQTLNLHACRGITDSVLQQLSQLSTLQSLDLSACNNITDNCLQHLVKLSLLRRLNLYYCNNINDDSVEQLRTNLPSTHIVR